MSVMPTRWITIACWLARGRSTSVDCALQSTATNKRLENNRTKRSLYMEQPSLNGGFCKEHRACRTWRFVAADVTWHLDAGGALGWAVSGTNARPSAAELH